MVKKKKLKKRKGFLQGNQDHLEGLIEREPLVDILNEVNFTKAISQCLELDDFESLVEIIEGHLWALQVKASMKDGKYPEIMPEEPKIDREQLRSSIEKAKRSSINVVTSIKKSCIEAHKKINL